MEDEEPVSEYMSPMYPREYKFTQAKVYPLL